MRKCLLILTLISCSAPATTVYRCEPVDRTIYDDKTCSEGKVLKIGNQPSDADKASEKHRTEKEQLIEKKLATSRLKREVAEERELKKAAKRAEIKQKKCAYLEQKARLAFEDAQLATGRNAEIAQTKSHRATERYVLECPK